MRRHFITFALIAGFIALLWGLFFLEHMLVVEREDALQHLQGEQTALTEFAQEELRKNLHDQLVSAKQEILAAKENPLLPHQHLFYWQHGEQLLPRLHEYASEAQSSAYQLFQQLMDATSTAQLIEASEAESPWQERLLLFSQLQTACESKSSQQVEDSIRQLIAHQLRYHIDQRKDLPLQLAIYTKLMEGATPDQNFLKNVLRDGLDLGAGQRLQGMQSTLLSHRSSFHVGDFFALGTQIEALSKRAGVRFDDFHTRLHEPASPLVSIPSTLSEAMLVADGLWYLEADDASTIYGITVDREQLLQTIRKTMQAKALLLPHEEVVFVTPEADVWIARSALISLHSDRWGTAHQKIEQRFQLKTMLVIFCGLLALTILILALTMQTRRQRFLRLKSDFIATVSHELRTPLAAIRLMAETLERRLQGIPQARDYPARMIHEIDDLHFLVDNILSFNRLEKGRWQPQITSFAFAELVHELHQDLALFSRIPVRLHYDEKQAVILQGDPALMQLLLRNLGKNACTYNERNPIEITIQIEEQKTKWRIEFRDNGSGIPASEWQRIFIDFYRPKTSAKSRGSGLGLAICRKIVQIHGGAICVLNSSEQGTNIQIIWPKFSKSTSS